MRLEEVVLQASDLARLRDFYCRVLGLPEVPGPGDTLALQAGRSRLCFQQADRTWQGYYHFAFDVPENQLAAAKAWLAGRVPLIADKTGADQFHFDSWNSDSVYFYDPAGNILEFIARHNAPTQATGPFGASAIVAVSEIGVACDDVPALVQRLRNELGVAVYADGAGAQFAPVGDEEGLLIVVTQGRIWFPDTGKPAVYAPLRLRLLAEPRREYTLTGPPYDISPAHG